MKRREKVEYEISPDNRLVIRRGDLAGYRQVLEGKFTTDSNNNLIYQVKLPAPRQQKGGFPRRVKLSGRWSLDQNHDLRFNLTGVSARGEDERLVLDGEIVSAEKDKLVFSLANRSGKKRRSVYLLSLTGRWQGDEDNRLTFQVERTDGEYDPLTFDGIWEINRRHQIVYRYQKSRRRSGRENFVVFQGHWEIRNGSRLYYWLDREQKSGFEFKASLGPVKLDGAKGSISFRLKIGISLRKRPVKKNLTFSGKWKVGKKLGVSFELEPSPGGRKKLLLGGNYRLNKANNLEFDLSNRRGTVVATGVTLKRKFFRGEALAFLKLRKSGDKSAIEGAVVKRF